MALLERILEGIESAAGWSRTWPPPGVRERWEKVSEYRRFLENDRATMLQHAPAFNRTAYGREIYTPVGLAREVCRYSADLLFSEEPAVTFEDDEDLLEAVLEANGLGARLVAMAESVAAEGRGALRVIRDDAVSEIPLVTHVHEDQVIWDERHGAFIVGGAVVIERAPDARRQEVFRLVEEHAAGHLRRRLYRGRSHQLGSEVSLEALPEFAEMADEEETGLDVPTLVKWDNVSGGISDVAGQEAILERINAEYSFGSEKSDKSRPVVFGHSSLFDEQGRADLGAVQVVGSNVNPSLDEGIRNLIETVQPEFGSAEQIAWIDFLIDSALLYMGYSKASYGRDEGGSADSGKALKLRQHRTLLKKAGKERMAREAIVNALSAALCWQDGGTKTAEYRPEVKLGSGLPVDELERAQELGLLESSESISLEERIRRLHPEWDEDAIDAEAGRIRQGTPRASVPRLNLGLEEQDGRR